MAPRRDAMPAGLQVLVAPTPPEVPETVYHLRLAPDGLRLQIAPADDPAIPVVKAILEELQGKISLAGMESIGLSSQAHIAMYGVGLVPVVRTDDGVILTENAAILQHVAERLLGLAFLAAVAGFLGVFLRGRGGGVGGCTARVLGQGHKQAEFLSAQPGEQGIAGRGTAQYFRRMFQGIVAACMADAIVDPLEMVDIDHRQHIAAAVRKPRRRRRCRGTPPRPVVTRRRRAEVRR